MTIWNATQHPATADQVAAGVLDLSPVWREGLSKLLTFDELPTREFVLNRAESITVLLGAFAKEGDSVMIGGAPFLMAPLEAVLTAAGYKPIYAFSVRRSVEEQIDGVIKKVGVFQHLGFV